jgi:hypothetical protein
MTNVEANENALFIIRNIIKKHQNNDTYNPDCTMDNQEYVDTFTSIDSLQLLELLIKLPAAIPYGRKFLDGWKQKRDEILDNQEKIM